MAWKRIDSSVLSGFFENWRRIISKKTECHGAFKINRNIKLIAGRKNQKMAFAYS